MASGDMRTVHVAAGQVDVTIVSDAFVPHKQVGNGDGRRLGIHLQRIAIAGGGFSKHA